MPIYKFPVVRTIAIHAVVEVEASTYDEAKMKYQKGEIINPGTIKAEYFDQLVEEEVEAENQTNPNQSAELPDS